MTAHLDLIRGRQVAIPLQNKSGISVDVGTVVVLCPDSDAAFELTTTEGDENVIGVAGENIRPDETGRIIVGGYFPEVKVSEPVTRGSFLVTSDVAGQATGKAVVPNLGCLGVALSSGSGTIEAFLFHAVRGPQGEQGIQGPQGPQGEQGPPGPIAGSDKQVIFNDNGNAAGDSGLVYDKATKDLTVGNDIIAGNRVEATNIERVKISSNDTTPDFLSSKITAGDKISVTEQNDGGNETLAIGLSLTRTKTVTMAMPGTLGASVDFPFHLYPGVNGIITKVLLSVTGPPSGSDIVVDVTKNGSSIFTENPHKPRILATQLTGETTAIDVNTVADSDYFSFTIEQVGSTVPGSNLLVHIYVQES